jgi:5-methylcytosine-specific restriction enzyme subunit McrC
MSIPILNIYYLLCYAWNKLEEKEIVDVKTQDSFHLADLLGKVLTNGTTYLFKKGLDRDYLEHDEELKTIRGKLLFGPSVKRHLLHQCIACCRFDELNYDVIHNQILKATLRLLLRLKDLDPTIKDEVAFSYRRFPNVSDIQLEQKCFQSVKLNRNNLFYDFLLHICRIIYDCVLMEEETGTAKFIDFERDEGKMSGLFEEFVRNFFIREQSVFQVKRDNIHWHVQEIGLHDDFLPIMQTDTSLIAKDGSQKLVIETKYYKNILQAKLYGRYKVISENLYQLYAYLKNLEPLGGVDQNCKGILLYASPGEDVDLRFALPKHNIRVKSINLYQPWKNIHDEMLRIISF